MDGQQASHVASGDQSAAAQALYQQYCAAFQALQLGGQANAALATAMPPAAVPVPARAVPVPVPAASVASHGEARRTRKNARRRHAAPAAPAPVSTDPGVLGNFTHVLNQLLDTLHRAFPECERLRAKREQFRTLVLPLRALQERVCRKWHEQLERYYDACTAHNAEPFLEANIDLLREIDFASKYAELRDDEANCAHLWEYITEANKYASLYCNIPPAIIGKIENVAIQLARDLQSGRTQPGSIDIMRLGKSVLEDASGGDVSLLMEKLSVLYKSIGGANAMSQASQAGVPMPSNVPDFSQMMQLGQSIAANGAPPGMHAEALGGSAHAMVQAAAQQASDAATQTAQQQPAARKGWRPPS